MAWPRNISGCSSLRKNATLRPQAQPSARLGGRVTPSPPISIARVVRIQFRVVPWATSAYFTMSRHPPCRSGRAARPTGIVIADETSSGPTHSGRQPTTLRDSRQRFLLFLDPNGDLGVTLDRLESPAHSKPTESHSKAQQTSREELWLSLPKSRLSPAISSARCSSCRNGSGQPITKRILHESSWIS